MAVSQDSLNTFERHQHSLNSPGNHSRQTLGWVLIHLIVFYSGPFNSVVYSEHQRQRQGFLGKRWEHAAIQKSDAFTPQLIVSGSNLKAMEHLQSHKVRRKSTENRLTFHHLTEDCFVKWIGQCYVDERRSPATKELPMIEGFERIFKRWLFVRDIHICFWHFDWNFKLITTELITWSFSLNYKYELH